MKVLHVIPSIAACRGGPSVAVKSMVRGLIAEGVDAAVLTTNDAGKSVLDVECGRWVNHDGVPVFFLDRWSPPVAALREYAFSPAAVPWFDQHLQACDLLHAHALFSHLPSAAMRRARREGIPYLLRPLGLLEEWSLRRRWARKRLHLAFMDSANIRGAARLHFTSESERAKSRYQQGRPAIVVPLGVATPARIPDAREIVCRRLEIGEGPVLLFLSRWHEKKGIEILLEAWGRVGRGGGTLVLAGAGDSGYERAVRARIQALPPGVRVVTPGFVEGEWKAALLQGADCFVLPSASENFAIAAAEALAAGAPVVTTAAVGVADAILREEAGWIVAGDAAALAQVLANALSDPAELRRRGDAARRLARRDYSESAAVRALAAAYAEIIG